MAPTFCSFWGCSRLAFKHNSFTSISHYRRTRSSLATRSSVLLTSEYNSHCRRTRSSLATSQSLLLTFKLVSRSQTTFKYDITLQTNIYRQRNALCDSRTLFALEMNTSVLETNASKTRVQTSATHTHTQLAMSNFQTELMSSSPSKTGAIPLRRSKRYLDAQRRLRLY